LSPVATLDGDPAESLRGLNTFPLLDGAVVWVAAVLGDYQLHRFSTAAHAPPTVIRPTAGPGAWVAVGSALPWPGSLECGPLVSGAVRVILPAGALYPTDEIWYLDATQTTELLHAVYTRTLGLVTQIQWTVSDLAGAPVMQITDVITYQGMFEVERVRTVS
jgi:hypothetical protein